MAKCHLSCMSASLIVWRNVACLVCLHRLLYGEMSLVLYVCIADCMAKCRLSCMSASLIVWRNVTCISASLIVWRNVACLVCLHRLLYGEMSLVLYVCIADCMAKCHLYVCIAHCMAKCHLYVCIADCMAKCRLFCLPAVHHGRHCLSLQ